MSGNNLFEVIKQIAEQTNNAGYPADFCVGVVTSANPLRIRIEQKDEVGEEFLILTDAVRDYNVDIEVKHTTENRAGGGGYAEYASHNHDYLGRKRITVYNALKVGESVVMLQQKGGQMFCVLSRIYDHIGLSGQWG